MNEDTRQAIREEIKVSVNGKIDHLREDHEKAHESLHTEIKEIKDSIRDMTEIFQATSGFFKTMIKIAQFIIPVATAIGIMYGMFNWVKK